MCCKPGKMIVSKVYSKRSIFIADSLKLALMSATHYLDRGTLGAGAVSSKPVERETIRCFATTLLPSFPCSQPHNNFNSFIAFISALKPVIAESKQIAELSKKFVMINVEVIH